MIPELKDFLYIALRVQNISLDDWLVMLHETLTKKVHISCEIGALIPIQFVGQPV